MDGGGQRQARRRGYASTSTGTQPGILFLEIDGVAYDVLRLAIRAGSVPTMARWLRDGTYRLFEWECDWSSQTGAMQAGPRGRTFWNWLFVDWLA